MVRRIMKSSAGVVKPLAYFKSTNMSLESVGQYYFPMTLTGTWGKQEVQYFSQQLVI